MSSLSYLALLKCLSSLEAAFDRSFEWADTIQYRQSILPVAIQSYLLDVCDIQQVMCVIFSQMPSTGSNVYPPQFESDVHMVSLACYSYISPCQGLEKTIKVISSRLL